MVYERLVTYFAEAKKHIDLIEESLSVLKYPIQSYDDLTQLQKFALNALIFRFSKLQDLIGSKIFRNYLNFSGFNLNEKTFFDILREIEKESIVDIDTWDELRELRNKIAHDYPQEMDEVLDGINLFLQKSLELIDISKKLEQKFYEIKTARDKYH